MYAPARDGQKLGDGSLVYSAAALANIAIPRIRTNNPDVRFIFIARHPRKRIESLYREMHHSGAHFGVAPPFRLSSFFQDHVDAIENTLFFDRISTFIKQFGRDAILPVFLEDFHADSQNVTRICCEHIGVDPEKLPPVGDSVLHSGSAKLYDTWLLRRMRRHPLTGFRIASLTPEQQNHFFQKIGLRRAFGNKPVVWDEPAEVMYRDKVVPQARKFLELCGKSQSFWKLDV